MYPNVLGCMVHHSTLSKSLNFWKNKKAPKSRLILNHTHFPTIPCRCQCYALLQHPWMLPNATQSWMPPPQTTTHYQRVYPNHNNIKRVFGNMAETSKITFPFGWWWWCYMVCVLESDGLGKPRGSRTMATNLMLAA